MVNSLEWFVDWILSLRVAGFIIILLLPADACMPICDHMLDYKVTESERGIALKREMARMFIFPFRLSAFAKCPHADWSLKGDSLKIYIPQTPLRIVRSSHRSASLMLQSPVIHIIAANTNNSANGLCLAIHFLPSASIEILAIEDERTVSEGGGWMM